MLYNTDVCPVFTSTLFRCFAEDICFHRQKTGRQKADEGDHRNGESRRVEKPEVWRYKGGISFSTPPQTILRTPSRTIEMITQCQDRRQACHPLREL
jgi:hypothetical protein